ncbi:hypothetical protein [Corynebacterium wankanglinii]|uniref:Uncharacterized protein n=1 Tax=Corynebacterium wankanglinii TaxID=2735136 RepID=A0A838CMR1_9CORY|nr:hypothetical protein [Corynebacterium wankanglinii]MBA1836192.1 hypothetical protein [Corynebacterium wankanglinii]
MIYQINGTGSQSSSRRTLELRHLCLPLDRVRKLVLELLLVEQEQEQERTVECSHEKDCLALAA